jgi:hypothetical protein
VYAAVPLLVAAFHWRAAAPGQAFVGWDLRNFFFAMREATAAALRAGEVPGWQRGIFMGYPIAGDPQAAWLAPATWLTLPWDAPRALTLATLLHLCAGGWGMALWMRVRGLSPAAGLLAATLFALGAKQTVHLQHWNFAASLAGWPWMLAGLDAFARTGAPAAGVGPAERGRGRWLLVTALAAALSWLGGAAQMAYFGALVAGAHALGLAPALWRRRPADALLALAAAPLGLLLAGPVILPVLELAGLGPRGAGVDYAFATSWRWPSAWGLALLVLPRSFGGSWRLEHMNLWEATGYLGILPVALAAAAPLRRRLLWLHLALAIVGVWLCFGAQAWLGLHRLLYDLLPGYGSFRNPTRSLMVTAFSTALLAAEGLDALRAQAGAGWRGRALRAGLVLGALALAAQVLPTAAGFPLDRERAVETAPVAVGLALAGLVWLALGSARPRLRGAGTWALAAVAIAGADLWLAFGDWNLVGPADGEPPALADLAHLAPAAPAPRRVAVVAKWGRTANAPLRLGLENATGYSPVVIQRVRSLLEATVDDRVVPPSPVTKDTNFPRPRPGSALWPLLAAPIVISDRAQPLPVLATGEREWEDPLVAHAAPALPRVFWAGRWEARGDDELVEPMLRAARGDVVIVAEEEAGRLAGTATGTATGTGPVAATEIRLGGSRLDAVVEAPSAGLAVILDPWFPGWTATVDGAPAPIVRADFAFMAVPVPPGRHALALTYRNAQVGRGAALSAATLALLVGALAWRRRVARRDGGA